MDRCHTDEVFNNVEGDNVHNVIWDFVDGARYLDKMVISIEIDGRGKGVGTVESFTYKITINHLEDCCTY